MWSAVSGKKLNCSNKTFVLTRMCEKAKEKKEVDFLAFVGLEKTYDRVD